MSTVLREGLIVTQGGSTSVNRIKDIIQGTVAIDLPLCAVGAVVQASVAVNGLTPDMNVLVLPNAWGAATPVHIAAASCGTDTLSVSCTNAGSASFDALSQTFAYFAWR